MPITIPVSPKVQQDISSQSSAAAPDVFKNSQSSAGKDLQDAGNYWLDAGSRLQGLSNEINKEVYLGKENDEKRMLAAEKEGQRISAIAAAEVKRLENLIVAERKTLARHTAVNKVAGQAKEVVDSYLQLNGAEAVDAFDQVNKQIQSFTNEGLKDFGGDELETLIVANALNTKLSALLSIASTHSIKQLSIANTSAKKTALSQSISSASQAIVDGNNSYAQSEQGAALQIAYHLAEKEGLVIFNDDSTLTADGKKVTLEVSSGVVVGSLTTMVANNNYKGANKLLNNAEKNGSITDGARNKVRKAITTGSNMQEAQEMAFTIYSSYSQAVEQSKVRGDGVTGIEGSFGQPSLLAMLDHVNSLVDVNPAVKKLSAGYLRERYAKIESDFEKANKANYTLALKHKEAGQTESISSSVMDSLTPEQRAIISDQWAERSDVEALVTVINNPNLMVGEKAWQWTSKLTRADWKKLYVRANGNNKTTDDKEGKGKLHVSGDIALINQELNVRGKNQLAGGRGNKATQKAKLIDRYYYQIEMLMEATDKPVDHKGRVEIINTIIDDIVYTSKSWLWGYGGSATNVSKGYVDSKNKTYADVDGEIYDMSTFTVDEIRIAKQQLTDESRELSSYEQKREAGLTLTAGNIAGKALLNREKSKNVRGK